MIYVENTSNYPQTVHIPRDEGENIDIRGYQFQKKDYNIDENGEYYIYPDPEFDGITAGTITVNVPTDTKEAYDQGFQDGEEAQKAKLEPLTATTNGHYANQDGYSDVYVNVEGGGGDVDYILLSQDYITSSAIGVGVNIGVTANTQWVVADYPDWMIFSPTAGTGTSTFYVQPQANTGESRVGIITLTGGTATRSIMVNQEGFNSYTGNTVSFVLYLGSPQHKSITLFDSSALQYVSGLKIDGAPVTPNTVISLPTQKSSNLTWSVEVELNTTEIQAPFFLPEPVDGTATFFWIDNILIGDGITLIDGGIFDFFAPNGQGTAKYPYPSNITLGASITSVTSNFMYIDRYGLRNITSYAVKAPLISENTFVPLDNTKFSNFYVPQCSDYSKWETMLSNAGATYQMHYFDNVTGCSYFDGYDDGFYDGEEAQKGLLGQFTASTNGLYTSETGYSAVTVNVQGGGGTNLTSETFTNNGTYTPGPGIDGWNEINIAVPTSAGTNIPITAVTEQTYQANSLGTYNFNISSGDTLRRLIVYFPQTGGTHITAWYQDDYGYSRATKLYERIGVDIPTINSMVVDDGAPIAPQQLYSFGDTNTHKVVFDMRWENVDLQFSDCTALTRVDMSERFTIDTPSCTNCTKLEEVKMKRAEEIGLVAFSNCSAFTITISEVFPLLRSIDNHGFTRSGVRSLGNLELDKIGDFAFSHCNNLYDCNLKNVRSVGFETFASTTFTEVTMPQVEQYFVANRCFLLNTDLQRVIFEINDDGIGKNGTIHQNTFVGCSSLNSINVNYEVPPPTVFDADELQTQNPLLTISDNAGTLNLMAVGQYSQAWRTWAATYIPGWTIQEAS